MVTKGSKKSSRYGRKKREMEIKKTILIVCEGKKTEPSYFEKFRKDLRGMASIKICGGDVCGTGAVQIVEHAIENKKGYDHVWAVFDRDSKPENDICRAFQMAAASNVNIAFSNPCFELWYLLHFQDQEAHILCKNGKNRLGKNICPIIKAWMYQASYLRSGRVPWEGRGH